MLDDYRSVKLKAPLSENVDTDGDETPDQNELKSLHKKDMNLFIAALLFANSVPLEMYLGETSISVWSYFSNPVLPDTDFDGISDKDDYYQRDNNFYGYVRDSHEPYDVEFKVNYRDFFNNNELYRDDLAVLGSIYANLAYNDAKLMLHTTAFTDEGISGAGIETIYDKFGLQDIKNYKLADYYNDDDISEMDIGHRLVEYNSTKKDIIMVSVRGTDSTIEEWSSNFDVGADIDDYWDRNNDDWKDKDNHKGFDVAANRLYERIIKYANTYTDSKAEKVIYIVGHSRGGAISNILGARFEDMPNYTSFTYTYAAPSTTTDINYERYKTIKNIVNEDDLVPCLPLNEPWNFNKYGKTYYVSIKDKYETEWEKIFGYFDYNFNGNLKSTINEFKKVANTREDLYRYTNDDNIIYTYSNSYYNNAQLAVDNIINKYGERISKYSQVYAVSKGLHPINGTLSPEVEVFDAKVKQAPAFLMMVLADITAKNEHILNEENKDEIRPRSQRGSGEDTYVFQDVSFFVAKKYVKAKNSFIYCGADTAGGIVAFLKIGGMVHAHIPGSYYLISSDSKNLLPY